MVAETRKMEEAVFHDVSSKEQVRYSSLIKDAARSAYQMAQTAFSSPEGQTYLAMEALILQEIEVCWCTACGVMMVCDAPLGTTRRPHLLRISVH